MANYLMPDTGQAVVQPSDVRSRGDVISVNDMYKLRIYNASKTIEFSGYIPPDFSISLQAAWTAPYGDTSLGEKAQEKIPGASGAINSIQRTINFGGASSILKVMSAKRWTQPSYLQLDLPIFLDAYSDSKKEVVENLVRLLSLCAPSESAGGLLIAPGPSPFKQVANEAVNQYDRVTGQSSAEFDDPEAFTVDIGNFFSMKPAVVDSVGANFDNVFEDKTGNPISCDFVLQVTSYFAVTREDLMKWFKLSQVSISGA